MKIGLLSEGESWHSNDFCRAANSRHSVEVFKLSQLGAGLGDSGDSRIWSGSKRLDQLDAVLVRTVPAGSLGQIVFRMDALAELARCGVTVVNPARTIEACVDKYLALSLLRRAGVAVPETIICQTSEDAIVRFHEMGGRVVLKPVFGSEGRGLILLDHVDLAARAFSILESAGETIYLQQFINHQNEDIRVFVAGDELRGMRRFNPNDWRVNSARGGQASRHVLSQQEIDTGKQICRCLGAIVAGIDLVYDRDGKMWVLEVNSAPGWKNLASVWDEDIADLIVLAIEQKRKTNVVDNATPIRTDESFP